jgi:hypothetical protein
MDVYSVRLKIDANGNHMAFAHPAHDRDLLGKVAQASVIESEAKLLAIDDERQNHLLSVLPAMDCVDLRARRERREPHHSATSPFLSAKESP